jgi:hypothetical protein
LRSCFFWKTLINDFETTLANTPALAIVTVAFGEARIEPKLLVESATPLGAP